MSANTKLPPPPPAPSNGVLTAPAGGNRKKQKRRAKQAAKAAAQTPMPPPPAGIPTDANYAEDPLQYDDEDDEDYDSEIEHEQYSQEAVATGGLRPPPPPTSGPTKNKQKAPIPGGGQRHQHHNHHHTGYPPTLNPPISPSTHHSSLRPIARGGHSQENIWNTSTQQERQNIKEFWLSLSEDERKALLKIEKDAVLKKMKQQQKHSCSCTVCGRKRTAIEEELEVLYEGYYEELEQYAHHDQPPLPSTDGMMPDPLQHRRPHPFATPPPPMPHHKTSHLHEHLDEVDFSDEEEYSDDEEYSDEEPEPEPEPPRGHPGVPDFFNFGSHLTVKGILTPWVEKLKAGLKGNADNLLTVADDLLKNDGRKFIEMMEQLAERRMQRESRSQYEAETHSGYPPNDPAYNPDDSLAAEDEYDDDEASYDSQEEYEDDMEEEDDMGGLTEEQRMQEGRRMFQIFAARMFEQRVLTAYREKVAAERQRKLLEELDDEDKLQAQREAKKQRDAQKKKEKKKAQQQAKAEEKAKRDAEKAAEEAMVREAEEKKLEEQRRKKEEQKKKREEEKRKQEEEKSRKEAEKQRRLQEEQQRREEAERKAREQKAAEKARKEEVRKREREEREEKERKAQEEKEKKEREARSKADVEAKEREKTMQQATQPSQHPAPPQITKRPSQAGMVAIPGVYPKQTTPGISSPHPQVATPAIPKAPTSNKQRHASHQGSHASSPKQAQSQLSSAPSKSSSPGSTGQQQSQIQPKMIMQKPSNVQGGGQQTQYPMQTPSPLHQQSIQPPSGMQHPHQQPGNFGSMPPMGYQGFPGPQGPMIPQLGPRAPVPMFPHQGPPLMAAPNRMSYPGMNGMPPPPGMMPPGVGPRYSFDMPVSGQPPPGFSQQLPHPQSQTSPIGQSPVGAPGSDVPRTSITGHTRQQSVNEKERFDPAINQPISRPAPIQRPNSVKPGSDRTGSTDIDDLSKHLGSSALLDDADDPIPPNLGETRRTSNMQSGPRNMNIPSSGIGQIGGFGAPVGGFGTPASSWGTPNMPFGQSPGSLGGPGWGTLPSSGMNNWGHNGNSFATNGAFGGMGPGPIHRGGAGLSRPLTIRLSVCQACKQLTNAKHGEGDGFHNVQILLRQIDANRPMLDSPPSLAEIEEICETEGDSQNGGGELHIRRSDADSAFAVKWEPDAGTPDQGRGHSGLGEIGSPMPSKLMPAANHFGVTSIGRTPGSFQNLGFVAAAAASAHED